RSSRHRAPRWIDGPAMTRPGCGSPYPGLCSCPIRSLWEAAFMMRVVWSRRRTLAAIGGVVASPMIASGVARASGDWPSKSGRHINRFPAGATTDVLSRIVCQELSELTGQQFIVENRSGSGGNVGADAIAKSAPDGYSVGLYSIASHAISPTLYAK